MKIHHVPQRIFEKRVLCDHRTNLQNKMYGNIPILLHLHRIRYQPLRFTDIYV